MKRQMIVFAALLLTACTSRPAALPKVDRTSTAWITLGTSGGPQVRPERAQIANALVLPDGGAYLFDTGNDVQRQLARAGVAESAIRAIFLSHHHLDHVADLGPLLWTHWTFGRGILTVIGPRGTQELVDGLVSASRPIMLAGYPTAGPAKAPLADMVKVVEVPANLQNPQEVLRDDWITVSAVGVDHYQSPPSVALDAMPEAVAYRIGTPDRTIVYTGDSGPSARLAELVAGADLLVSEVVELGAITSQLERGLKGAPASVREGIIAGMRINHLTPEEIGRMAQSGRVRAVLLTHFVPVPENVTDRGVYLRKIGELFSGQVMLAEDLGHY